MCGSLPLIQARPFSVGWKTIALGFYDEEVGTGKSVEESSGVEEASE